MRGEDFVHVKLSAAGEKLAGEHPLRFVSTHKDFTFKPGESQRVTRAVEWERLLKHQVKDGEPLFELDDRVAALPSARDLAAADEPKAAEDTK